MPTTHCLGFGLVVCDRLLFFDQFPGANQKLSARDWAEQTGGPAAVGLMTMAALGLRVRWGLPLGGDQNSERVKAQFRRLGIEVITNSHAHHDDRPTPEAIILVDRSSGARTVLFLEPRAKLFPAFEEIAAGLPAAEWIYSDGRDERFTLALKDWAKERRSKLFFDLGSLRPNWERIIAGADIVIVSDDFMRQWDSSLTPEITLQRLAACRVKIAGMTLGREGSLFLHQEKYVSIPADTAGRVIDTTNAGDVFHGAFLAAWIKTGSIQKSAAFASRCAAWAVTQIGHNLNHIERELVRQFERLA